MKSLWQWKEKSESQDRVVLRKSMAEHNNGTTCANTRSYDQEKNCDSPAEPH